MLDQIVMRRLEHGARLPADQRVGLLRDAESFVADIAKGAYAEGTASTPTTVSIGRSGTRAGRVEMDDLRNRAVLNQTLVVPRGSAA